MSVDRPRQHRITGADPEKGELLIETPMGREMTVNSDSLVSGVLGRLRELIPSGTSVSAALALQGELANRLQVTGTNQLFGLVEAMVPKFDPNFKERDLEGRLRVVETIAISMGKVLNIFEAAKTTAAEHDFRQAMLTSASERIAARSLVVFEPARSQAAQDLDKLIGGAVAFTLLEMAGQTSREVIQDGVANIYALAEAHEARAREMAKTRGLEDDIEISTESRRAAAQADFFFNPETGVLVRFFSSAGKAASKFAENVTIPTIAGVGIGAGGGMVVGLKLGAVAVESLGQASSTTESIALWIPAVALATGGAALMGYLARQSELWWNSRRLKPPRVVPTPVVEPDKPFQNRFKDKDGK